MVDRKGRQRNGRRESPAFQFYPQDFLSSPKVRHMSCAARGAYITLLCDCWLEGGLETDLGALACRVGMEAAAFAELWRGALGRCFDEIDGRFVNPRMERERQLAEEYRTKMSEAGERSAEVRRANAEVARQRRKGARPTAPAEPASTSQEPGLNQVQPTCTTGEAGSAPTQDAKTQAARRRQTVALTTAVAEPVATAKEPVLPPTGPLSIPGESRLNLVQPTCTPVPSRPNPERANYVSSPPYPPAGGAAAPRGQDREPPHVDESDADPGPPSAVVERVLAKDLELATPDVAEDLDRWAVHRREIGRPLGASSVRKLLSVARKDPTAFRRRVEASIESGTTVLLEDRPRGATAANGERLTAREAKQRRDHESGAKLERMLEEQLAKASGTARAPRSASAVDVWTPNGSDAAHAKPGAFLAVTAEVRPC